MKYEEITINHLFGEKSIASEKLSVVENNAKFENLRQEIKRNEKIFQWKKIQNEISENCTKLLNVPLKTILEKAWKKYEEVSQYLDTEKYGDENTFLIPLVEHTVVSEHHPKIEVSLGATHLATFDFDVHLELILNGILLKISKGKIQGVEAGKCKSKASLSCEGIVLFEDESREFEFY
jgi:hypothetical protein